MDQPVEPHNCHGTQSPMMYMIPIAVSLSKVINKEGVLRVQSQAIYIVQISEPGCFLRVTTQLERTSGLLTKSRVFGSGVSQGRGVVEGQESPAKLCMVSRGLW